VSEAHPAQADNLAVTSAMEMLRKAARELEEVAALLEGRPKPALRDTCRRRLSGVLSDVETVRLSIKN
jgi:hypothetical protein